MSEKILVHGSYSEDVLNRIAGILFAGGVVIMPSDTVYGFLFTQAAAEKVKELKKRDDKPFLFFIHDFIQLKELGVDYLPFLPMLKKNWPGPFTFIFNNDKGTTSGVRMPAWQILDTLLRKTGKVLYSTSVNYSGKPPMQTEEEIEAAFGNLVDLLVFDSAYAPGVPSAVVQLLPDKSMKIIRSGKTEVIL